MLQLTSSSSHGLRWSAILDGDAPMGESYLSRKCGSFLAVGVLAADLGSSILCRACFRRSLSASISFRKIWPMPAP